MSFFDDVGTFHAKFDLPVARRGVPCIPMGPETTLYRLRFLYEELREFERALQEDDLHGQIDALADLVYVALGTAHYLGAPFNEVWQAVQTSNLSKERGHGEHKRGPVEVIRKPVGWQPPDIKSIVEHYNLLHTTL